MSAAEVVSSLFAGIVGGALVYLVGVGAQIARIDRRLHGHDAALEALDAMVVDVAHRCPPPRRADKAFRKP